MGSLYLDVFINITYVAGSWSSQWIDMLHSMGSTWTCLLKIFWLKFKSFHTYVWIQIPYYKISCILYRIQSLYEVLEYCNKTIHCGRLLRKEHVHQRCCTSGTVRLFKFFGENFIVRSLYLVLFINITYVAGSWSSYAIEL